MKRFSSSFKVGLAAVAVCLGASSDVVIAQNSSPKDTSGTTAPATVAAGAKEPALPYGVGDVVKMYRAGINKEVIIGYIRNTAYPYHLSADQIIYLQSLGMPQEITTAMVQHDGQMPQQTPAPTVAANGATEGQAAAEVAVPTTPAPDVTVYPDYSYYYAYPYYDYYWWPPVVVGGGWWRGHGWDWGHERFGGVHGGVDVHRSVGGGSFHGGFHGGSHGGFGGGHGGGRR